MAALASFVDSITGIQQAFHVLLLDRLERLNRGIVKSVCELHPGGPILIDERFDLLRSEFDFRIFGLLAGFGHMASRNQQQIRGFQEHDRVIPDVLPLLVRTRHFLLRSFRTDDRFDGIPYDVGTRIDHRIHNVLYGRRRPELRLLLPRLLGLLGRATRSGQDHYAH